MGIPNGYRCPSAARLDAARWGRVGRTGRPHGRAPSTAKRSTRSPSGWRGRPRGGAPSGPWPAPRRSPLHPGPAVLLGQLRLRLVLPEGRDRLLHGPRRGVRRVPGPRRHPALQRDGPPVLRRGDVRPAHPPVLRSPQCRLLRERRVLRGAGVRPPKQHERPLRRRLTGVAPGDERPIVGLGAVQEPCGARRAPPRPGGGSARPGATIRPVPAPARSAALVLAAAIAGAGATAGWATPSTG